MIRESSQHYLMSPNVKRFVGAIAVGTLALSSVSVSASAACKNADNALGVERIVTIDTTDGPLYGSVQYRDNKFLKKKEVVLTFDDGPNRRYTKRVLAALKKHCTKATFFMVGRMARSDPKMVRTVAAAGHTIGSHTWSHKDLNKRSKRRGIRQIELGVSAISKALGKPIVPFFRFPYLSAPRRMVKYLQDNNVAVFSIDIDSKDYRTSRGSTMGRKVLRDLKRRGKGIILFHDIQRSTARGLEDLLDELKDKGYKVVHLVAKTKTTTKDKFDAEATKLFGGKKLPTAAHDHSKDVSGQLADQSAGKTKLRKSEANAKKKKTSKSELIKKREGWAKNAFKGG